MNYLPEISEPEPLTRQQSLRDYLIDKRQAFLIRARIGSNSISPRENVMANQVATHLFGHRAVDLRLLVFLHKLEPKSVNHPLDLRLLQPSAIDIASRPKGISHQPNIVRHNYPPTR